MVIRVHRYLVQTLQSIIISRILVIMGLVVKLELSIYRTCTHVNGHNVLCLLILETIFTIPPLESSSGEQFVVEIICKHYRTI